MRTLTVSVLICAVSFMAEAYKIGPRRRSCPVGWMWSNGRCFHFVPAKLSWAKAEKNCQTMGANLASVHSADEYHDIQIMIAKITKTFEMTWLGGSNCQEKAIWLWSDGSPFNYRHCAHFDNFFWRQHCMQMNYGANKCWDDVQCYSELPSVCAKSP